MDLRAAPASRLASALLLLGVGAVFAMALTWSATGAWDDGLYLVLGKALATGRGYHVVSLPAAPADCAHPPLYALLLGLGWLLQPGFPDNLWLLKGFNLAFALAALAGTYDLVRRGLSRPAGSAWLAAGLLALGPAIWSFLDLTMAELAYLMTSVLALGWVQRRLHPDSGDGRLVLAALVCAVPALVRSQGLALALGVAAWLLWQRRFRSLAVFGLASLLARAPWLLWVQLTLHGGGPVYFDYAHWVDQNVAQTTLPAIAASNARELLFVALPAVLLPIYGALAHARHLSWLATPALVLGLGACLAGFVRTARERFAPHHGYVVVFLAVILPYPWPPARFVMALAPLLLFYLVEGCRWLAEHRPGRVLAGLALALCAAWGLQLVAVHLRHADWPLAHPDPTAPALRALVAAVPPGAVVLCDNSTVGANEFMVHLATGHPTLKVRELDQALAARRPIWALTGLAAAPVPRPPCAPWRVVREDAGLGVRLYVLDAEGARSMQAKSAR